MHVCIKQNCFTHQLSSQKELSQVIDIQLSFFQFKHVSTQDTRQYHQLHVRHERMIVCLHCHCLLSQLP